MTSNAEVDTVVNTLYADLLRAASLDIVGTTAAVMNGDRIVCRYRILSLSISLSSWFFFIPSFHLMCVIYTTPFPLPCMYAFLLVGTQRAQLAIS